MFRILTAYLAALCFLTLSLSVISTKASAQADTCHPQVTGYVTCHCANGVAKRTPEYITVDGHGKKCGGPYAQSCYVVCAQNVQTDARFVRLVSPSGQQFLGLKNSSGKIIKITKAVE
jgi:hypothetical protein